MPKKPPLSTTGFREEAAAFAGASDQYVAPLKATTEIGRDGRIVIPAAMREAMGARDGATLVLLLKGDTLEIFTAEAGLKRIQEMVRKVVPPEVSLVEELFKERRAWAEEEDND